MDPKQIEIVEIGGRWEVTGTNIRTLTPLEAAQRALNWMKKSGVYSKGSISVRFSWRSCSKMGHGLIHHLEGRWKN